MTNTNHTKLLELSRQVLLDCSLENGAIVAANSTKSYFPSQAKNYFYVWPRDAAFACLAANSLGITKVQKRFFDWCLARAEGFSHSGLFYEKYYPNGLKALNRFQPDQTGAVLFAVYDYLKKLNKKLSDDYKDLIEKAANGICSIWNKNHFTINTNDLWEERLCFPDLKENFTYSLAACIRGLRCSNEMLPNKKWAQIANEMQDCLEKNYTTYFIRSGGKLPDERIDASVMGLLYPFQVLNSDDARIKSTINEIESKLLNYGGVHRYEHDEYDGWMHDGEHRKKGAGAWPLLNFWLAICYAKMGEQTKAKEKFNWVLKQISDTGLIPEQIFQNDVQVSVAPLLWSHVMYILAARELNIN